MCVDIEDLVALAEIDPGREKRMVEGGGQDGT